jgi:hypothetical protein
MLIAICLGLGTLLFFINIFVGIGILILPWHFVGGWILILFGICYAQGMKRLAIKNAIKEGLENQNKILKESGKEVKSALELDLEAEDLTNKLLKMGPQINKLMKQFEEQKRKPLTNK